MKKSFVYGSNLFAYTMIVLCIIGLVNFVAFRNYKRIDMTESGRFSLSSQTVKIIKTLPFEVKTLVFIKDNPAQRLKPRRILQQYESIGKNFQWAFIDPDKNPQITEKYGITRYDSYVVEGQNGKKETFNGNLTEEALTNALIKILSEKEKKVYFVTGHGEKNISGTGSEGYNRVTDSLKRENFKVEELRLFGVDEAPKDASLLIVAGPKKDIPKSEIEKLEKYLRKGGKILFMIDAFTFGEGEALEFLERFGVKANNDVVVDRTSKMLGGDYLAPVAATYDDHSITRNFTIMTMYPLARSLKIVPVQEKGIIAAGLAKSLPNAWGETNLKGLTDSGTVIFDKKKDHKGPVYLSAVVELIDLSEDDGKEPKNPNGAMVVIGDSDFVSNSHARLGGNLDFFMNAVNWLAEREDMISIRPRKEGMDPIIFSANQYYLIAGFSAVGLPFIVFVAGSWIYVARRRS